MKKQHWVLVPLLEELLSGILKEEHVPIVKWVSELEGVDSISASLLDFCVDLGRGKSVLIKLVIELYISYKLHA